MFETATDVIRALARYRDFYDPRSTSIMVMGGASTDPTTEPFRAGFIEHLDERRELLRRLGTLDQRDRRLLTLWYGAGMPVARIAALLGVSRVHCYRLQRRAIASMLDAPAADLRAV